VILAASQVLPAAAVVRAARRNGWVHTPLQTLEDEYDEAAA
jgi:hypothetical protein